MLNQTALRLPFPPDSATQAVVETTTAGVTTRQIITSPAAAQVVPLGTYPSGAVLAVAVYWFAASGAEIVPSVPDVATYTLASGPDSPLGLTITTGPSPVVPQVDAPASGATAAQ